MESTHAAKAGIRYRYYVSLICLHGEAKTVKVGSVTRVSATDIEDVVVKSLNEHLRIERGMQEYGSATSLRLQSITVSGGDSLTAGRITRTSKSRTYQLQNSSALGSCGKHRRELRGGGVAEPAGVAENRCR
jgi:hypothetical protein